MKKKLIFAAIATMGVLVLAGCGSTSSSQQADNSSQSSNTQAGSEASSQSAGSSGGAAKTTNTGATASAGDAAKGKAVFDQSCASCHSTGTDQIVGPGLKGITAQPTIAANGKPMNDTNLTEWIKTGGTGKIGNMPGMAGSLSDQQIADVVAYVKTLK
ncbi:cytochrome c [Fodinisporobacter ferrooxydans]|uniref:Cytochrome c n=1 Tax=Fodinisporobacter ferrooxydans TaxID=2901836 RepID=A0ABY4CNJ3_9BACL|nr:cytochrome c [Alicyclobacillaceae bacterium MYW30-H2]